MLFQCKVKQTITTLKLFSNLSLATKEDVALLSLQFVICKCWERVKWLRLHCKRCHSCFIMNIMKYLSCSSIRPLFNLSKSHFILKSDTNIKVRELPLFYNMSPVVTCLARDWLKACVKRFDILPCLPWCHTAIFSLPEDWGEEKKGLEQDRSPSQDHLSVAPSTK